MSAPPTGDEVEEWALAIASGDPRRSAKAYRQLAADAVRRAYDDPDRRAAHLRDAVQLEQRAEVSERKAEADERNEDRAILRHLRELRNRGDGFIDRFRKLGRGPRAVN